MSVLDEEKVRGFVDTMSEKSDEEILKIFRIKDEYQPEAAKAVVEVAIIRGLIDYSQNEIKQEQDTTEEWYYEFNKKRVGAVSYNEVSSLIKNNILDQDSLVWKNDFTNWKAIKDTELKDLLPNIQPPPLTGNKVTNTFIWLLAFAPIIGSIIQGEFLKEESLIFLIAINSVFALLDDLMLNRAGHKTGNWFWALIIIPVYIWKRSNVTKQSKSPFWIWLASFFISLIVSASYYPNAELAYLQYDNVEVNNNDVKEVKEPKSEFKIGDLIKLDEMNIQILDFEVGKIYNSAWRPEKGMKSLAVEVMIENTTNTTIDIDGVFHFKIQDENSYSYDAVIYGTKNPSLDISKLSAGRKIRGWITFEVKNGSKEFEVVYSKGIFSNKQYFIKLN